MNPLNRNNISGDRQGRVFFSRDDAKQTSHSNVAKRATEQVRKASSFRRYSRKGGNHVELAQSHPFRDSAGYAKRKAIADYKILIMSRVDRWLGSSKKGTYAIETEIDRQLQTRFPKLALSSEERCFCIKVIKNEMQTIVRKKILKITPNPLWAQLEGDIERIVANNLRLIEKDRLNLPPVLRGVDRYINASALRDLNKVIGAIRRLWDLRGDYLKPQNGVPYTWQVLNYLKMTNDLSFRFEMIELSVQSHPPLRLSHQYANWKVLIENMAIWRERVIGLLRGEVGIALKVVTGGKNRRLRQQIPQDFMDKMGELAALRAELRPLRKSAAKSSLPMHRSADSSNKLVIPMAPRRRDRSFRRWSPRSGFSKAYEKANELAEYFADVIKEFRRNDVEEQDILETLQELFIEAERLRS